MSNILRDYLNGYCYEKLSEIYKIPVKKIKKIVYQEEMRYFR